LKIAIDALGLPPIGGARSSAVGWLTTLGEHDQENTYTVYVSQRESALDGFKHFEQRVAPTRDRLALRVWAQVEIPWALKRERFDLLHSMKNLGLPFAPCPAIVTVNDLTHVLMMKHDPWPDRLYWRYIQPSLLRRAHGVIAISHSVKQDLIQRIGLNPARISVIHPACSPSYYCDYPRSLHEQVRRKYQLPERVLLYVGGLALHKNVGTLIRAFGRIQSRVPHHLAIVGGAYHAANEVGLAALVDRLSLDGRVSFLGPVSDEDLPILYRLADLFVLPSLNEGFGLVLLEAMASGTPVLATKRGSIPEVLGDAGALVDDPMDQEALADAMMALLSSSEMLALMRAKGLARSEQFGWDATAEATLHLYRKILIH
jgi:glycosyltransferase involved in cell wall biosynthesis